LTDIYRITSI